MLPRFRISNGGVVLTTVLEGLRLRVSEHIGSCFSAARTGELALPRGGMTCPAAEGGGNFHEGKSVTLECLDVAMPLGKKLAEDLRSGASFIGMLSTLVARLPSPAGGVRGLGGVVFSEVFSKSAHSCEVGCDMDFDTFRSFVPSSRRESFWRTVPSLEEVEASRISERSRMQCRANALMGRWKPFIFDAARGISRDLTFSVLARFEYDFLKCSEVLSGHLITLC